MKLILAKIGNHETVRYAFDELVRCLKYMDESLFIEGRTYNSYDETAEGVLWVGIDGTVGASVDDEIRIDVKDGVGSVTGSNERSVLIAAYRLLYELGCRWIRPGADGEILIKRKMDKEALNVQVAERASYRHRAVCIEGINSYEHIYNMIEWLPRVGMNGYFVQFRVPYCFFEGRYMHDAPSVFAGRKLELLDVAHIWQSLEEEMKERSLMYHAIGHGWTCEPFGIKGTGWSVETEEISPEIKKYFAEVDGKRELWGGKALNTNLCYSNPCVRNRMTDAITEYCLEHPNVDYLHFCLHFWLADDFNNHCECAECQKMRPADYYVMTLNELDRKLTAAGVDTRIVFLLYMDLLWEPEYCKIENPDRFVLMFAPITRTYTQALVDSNVSQEIELAPYKRNKLDIPKSVAENVARLSRWQELFKGDSFDFDYHLMWDHVMDPGYYECARILHKDMVNLDKIGLNGMVSCQIQRVAFPTNLPMYSMARALWDKTSDFEEIAAEYFAASFGNEGELVRGYLSTLSDLFHAPYLRGELPQKDEKIAKDFVKAGLTVKDFKASYIDRYTEGMEKMTGRKLAESAVNVSWKYLAYHAEYCELLSELLRVRALGEKEKIEKKAEEIKEYMDGIQQKTHEVLDNQNHWYAIKRAKLHL